MAYLYDRYLSNCPDAAVVKQAEAIAQASRVGVWSGNYQKPWTSNIPQLASLGSTTLHASFHSLPSRPKFAKRFTRFTPPTPLSHST